MVRAITFFSFIFISSTLTSADAVNVLDLTDEQRGWYVNPDGSCVQCSIGMIGTANADLNWATVLFDSAYGKAERGGSGPSRVASYAHRRGMKAWNVTGSKTKEWMIWAANTRRFGAIGFFSAHFQTLYGYDPDAREWWVCNNWYAQPADCKVTKYSDSEFVRLHHQSGEWVVIPEKPAPLPPKYVTNWK